MIVAGFDLESTGLDLLKDRPIEMAITLWSTKMQRSMESESIFIKSDGVPVTDEITEITGITQAAIDKFGYEPADAFERMVTIMQDAEAIVAFNGRRFDVPLSINWAKRVGQLFPDKLLIDPSTDVPMRSQELITMCAKKGIFYNAHEALGDVSAMLHLMSKFDFDVVLTRAQSPILVVQSKQDYSNNKAAKKHRFRWNPDEKIWWKAIKECDLDALVKAINNEFGLQVRSDLTSEMLDTE